MTSKEEPLHLPMSFDKALAVLSGGAEELPPVTVDLMQGDCREAMAHLAANSVHMVLTDPPYFLDGLDNEWRKGGADATRATGTVGTLPVGMRFDRKQGEALQPFMREVATEWFRVLVPGAFALVFSQPRLSHRLAVGIEEAGFEIRDMIAWRFTKRAQFKAFSMNHFVEKMDLPEKEKKRLIRSLRGRKTPQLRPQYETVVLAQKPREGTFVENWQKWRAGLMDATRTIDGMVPSNVVTVEKPDNAERARCNGHLTPKPIMLLSHLIELFTERGQIVLDSFLGSGSTAVAAIRTARSCIGIEINPDYLAIARERVEEAQQ